MKELIKFILNIFDFFTQQKILNALKKEIKGNKISVLIDVGSHKGEYILSLKSKFLVEKIFGFEPNPDIYNLVNKKFSTSNNIIVFNYGISDSSGVIEFNKNLESSSSSMNNLNTNSKYYKKKFFLLNFLNLKKITTKINVEVKRLDEFFKLHKIQKVDLIKIDTEGFEFRVLKSLGQNIRNIKIIHFEHHFDDMIIKNYKFSDIHHYLVCNGFKKIFKIKMKFRKSFEYIYVNKEY